MNPPLARTVAKALGLGKIRPGRGEGCRTIHGAAGMDNDEMVARDGTAVRPVGGDYSQAGASTLSGAEDGDRNPVFTNLVKADNDIVGLVAYSIYKQNKLDW